MSTFDRNRTISLEAGRYFVRGRDATFALEGAVDVTAGSGRSVDDGTLRRLEYAHLVRKGIGPASVTAVRAGLVVRSPVNAGESACAGGFMGVRRSTVRWIAEAQLGACRATFSNDTLDARSDELVGELRVGLAWELGPVTLEPAVVAGASAFRQAFTTRGVAPARWIGAGHVGAAGAALVEVPRGFHVFVDVDAASYVFEKQMLVDHAPASSALGTTFVLRFSVGIGKYL